MNKITGEEAEKVVNKMTVEKAEKAGGGGQESIHMTGEKAENVVKKMTVEKAEKAEGGGQESIQMTGEKSGKAASAGQESNNGSGGHPANSKSRSSRWDNDHPVSKSRSNRKDKQQPISKQGTQPGQVASPPDIDAVTAVAQNAAAGSPMESNTTPAVQSHKSIPKPLHPTEKEHSQDSVDAGHPKKPRLENAVAKPVEFGFEILDRRSITMMDGTVRTYYSLPRSEQREPFPSDDAAASSLENARFGSRELNPGHHSHGNQNDLPLENPHPHGGTFDARKAEFQRFYAANTMAPPHQDDLPPENPHPHGGPFDARKAELQRFYAANPMEPPPPSVGLGYENYGSSVYGNFRKVPGDECSNPRDGYPENGADKGPSIEIRRERNYVPAGVPGSDGSAMEGHPDRNLVPEGFGPVEGLRAPRSSQGFHVSTRPVSARMSPREPIHGCGSGDKSLKRKHGRG